jgi:ParB family chromosome partitioning protein
MATTTKQRGLGKGLSALISESYVQPTKQVVEASAAGVSQIHVTKLHAGEYQPRSHFDEGALAELSESIAKNGLVQPIIVRPSAKNAGKFEIIAGERRWRAAKMAGLTEIQVVVREINNQQALELALIENIQRKDLSPLEEASGYQRLIEEFNYTQEALAGSVGKSRSHVTNLLRLLSLPKEVKEMLEKGQLTMGHARALLTAENPVELAREIIAKGLSVRQIENYRSGKEATKTESKTKAPAASGGKDPDILALEDNLSESLGVKVSITDRGQRGEITLAYDSLSQLDEILRRLGNSVGI